MAGVPVPALPAFKVVGAPAAFTKVTVLVAFSTAFNVVLPMVKPVLGIVSLLPAAKVKVTGPVIAVTLFKAVTAVVKLA